MKSVKKGLHFCVDAILKIAIVFAVVLIVASFFGYRTYIIQSGSMEPVLHTGSVVVVNEFATYDDVEVGDIIAFKTASGAKVTHRVIAITAQGMETKGDNNELSDGITTTKANFCGITYEFCVPGVGYTLERFNQPNGKIAAVLIVFAVVLLEILLDDDESDKKEKKKTLAVKKVEMAAKKSELPEKESAPAEPDNQDDCNTEA